jgi:hypothetical protein
MKNDKLGETLPTSCILIAILFQNCRNIAGLSAQGGYDDDFQMPHTFLKMICFLLSIIKIFDVVRFFYQVK